MKLWQWIVGGVLAAGLIGVGIFAGAQAQTMEDYRNELDAMYKKAWWESTERLSSLEIELEKLIISDSPQASTLRLSTISRQADSAAQNLGSLPMERAGVNGAMKFINQIADYSAALGEGIAQGRPISETDIDQLQKIQVRLSEMNDIIYDLDALDNWAGEPEINIDINTIAQENMSYPTLIYDGPFSDGSQGIFKGLGAEKVDSARALLIATEYTGGTATLTGTTTAPVNGFDISCATDIGTFDLFVTETGGRVLYMMPSDDVVESELATASSPQDVQSSIDVAAQYLLQRGFMDMAPNYTQQGEGVLVINFAAMQGGVTLYPDLVKVQVSGGRVVGLEAGNYWRNHVTRALPEVQVDYATAQGALNPRLSVMSARMALIPTNRNDGMLKGEALCYEFTCTLGQSKYLVYIDALSGLETSILKLMEDGAV